ncbi:MAG: hypothetical protein ACP5PA_05225 [Elusimicrobiales bacterium]
MKKISVFLFLLSFAVSLTTQENKDKKVDVDIYFEPFTASGWQSFIYLDLISRKTSAFNIRIYPFIKKKEGGWLSNYNEAELKETARLEALIEKYPSKLNDYLRVRAISISVEGWKDALIYAGINPVEFDDYVEKNKDMLLENAFNRLKKRNIEKPAVYVRSERFDGFSNFLDAVGVMNKFLPQIRRFNLFTDSLSKIKPPRFIIVYDTNTSIDQNIVMSFKKMFGELREESFLYENLNISIKDKLFAIPAYIIEKKSSVKEYLGYAIKQGIMEDLGDYYVYYDMRNEARLLKSQKKTDKLEVFVMSQCPFGVKAVESIIDYIERGKIESSALSIHYIGDVYEDLGGYRFNSLHGDDEWKEDMRQIVISKYYPDKFFTYMKLRLKNYQSPDWQSYAKEAQIPITDLEDKIEKEGKKLLADDFRYTSSLKINTSPTFLVNGDRVIVGISNLKKIKGYEDINIDVSNAVGGCGK